MSDVIVGGRSFSKKSSLHRPHHDKLQRDVVILSIKPKRPEFPPSVKAVPVTELHQEWDKLDAYYRGQLLKVSKSLKTPSPPPVGASGKKSSHRHSQKSEKSSPVEKKNSTDQFNELFGDENLFSPLPLTPPPDGDKNRKLSHQKLLHSRSLNSLFDEEEVALPQRNSRWSSNSSNLLVSIPVLTNGRGSYHRLGSDGEDEVSSSSDEDEVEQNFLSVPRDNFQVQYGTKQKTRVALFGEGGGGGGGKLIAPLRVAPYKPPAAQGLNAVQIQKILYHKNDSVNFASPTTTSARTPNKPPDSSPPPVKTNGKVESPVSTVSPRSTTSSNSVSPPTSNNNATPKQATTPELSPASAKSSTPSPPKSSSPPNSTTGLKLKRPSPDSGNKPPHHSKQRRFDSTTDHNSTSGHYFPVTSTSNPTFSFSDSESPKKFKSPTSSSHGSNKSTSGGSDSHHSSTSSPVFIPPAAVSITDRIIKKASRPQPELLERQRRRRYESNLRKTYAAQKGDEHERQESIDLSMKSFEMIMHVPLLSPLRSP